MWAYIASPDYKYFILLNDQSTILLHPFVSPFHSTGQHLWLSYPVPFHCIIYPFPLSHFIPSRNALLNDRFILLISLTHHASRLIPHSARSRSSRSTYSTRLRTTSSFLPRKPKHSFRLDPSTSLENCVGVNYTPSSTLFSSSTPASALLAL